MRYATETRRAFTLIELLVVITIIAVLMALLVPALEKSIIQAQLVVCQASNLKTISAVCNTYAVENKRVYPNARPENYSWDALFLRNTDWSFDMRPLFAKYLHIPDPLQIFADPLAGQIRFDDEANKNSRTHIYSNYMIYSGWGVGDVNADVQGNGGYKGGHKKMTRLGDGFEFPDSLSNPDNPVHYRFPILATDYEQTGYWGYWSTSSHPDQMGTFEFVRYQDQVATPDAFTSTGLFGFHSTISYWQGQGFQKDVVSNFAYADGSVMRVDNVKYDDPRMAKIPVTGVKEYNAIRRYSQLPKAH